MFFAKLLPREGNFFELFNQHGAHIAEGSRAFVAMIQNYADTDLRHAFRSGLESVFATGDRQLEDAMAEGRTRMIDATTLKMRQYGCAGKAEPV